VWSVHGEAPRESLESLSAPAGRESFGRGREATK
jgi:transposase